MRIVLLWFLYVVVASQNDKQEDVLDQIFGDIIKEYQATSTTGAPGSLKIGDVPDGLTCKMKTGGTGVCVPYHRCQADYSVNSDVTVIDIRETHGQNCASYLDACCTLPQVKDESPKSKITPSPDKQNKSCGQWNKNGVGFKITGDKDGEAQFAEFPWMCAILEFLIEARSQGSSQSSGYLGGGSLIHPSVVLTAAHTVAGRTRLLVRAGEWDTQTTKEPYPHQDRFAGKVIAHEDFNQVNLQYDIALIVLTVPMDLAPNVGLICLPSPSEVPRDTKCFASGWGASKFGQGNQVILKKVNLPVVDHDKCEADLKNTRLSQFFTLHSSFMCAGGGRDQDTCKGDGGSPLVCPADNSDRYSQRGIVSWGIGCGEVGTPGVYVNVSGLRTWIDEKVVAEGFDPKVYTI